MKDDLIGRLRILGLALPIAREAADAIERMQSWIEGDCNCPCCQEIETCLDGCTFAEDDPNAAARMAGAREALFGTKG